MEDQDVFKVALQCGDGFWLFLGPLFAELALQTTSLFLGRGLPDACCTTDELSLASPCRFPFQALRQDD